MLEGIDELTERLRKLSQSVPDAFQGSLLPAAQELLAEAQELAPKASGDLADSGYAIPTLLGAEVGFTAPYAVPVHERLDVSHPQGQAKFLEIPLLAFGEKMLQIAGAACAEEMNG